MSLREDSDIFWIRVRILGPQDDDKRYRVEVELDNGRWYQHQMRLGDEEERELLAIPAGNSQAYGAKLYQLLFPDSGNPDELSPREALQIAWGAMRGSDNAKLRVQLWISKECSELHQYRWERLFVPLDGKWRSLANFNRTPFSRFTRLPLPDPRLDNDDRPLKVLVAISNPKDLGGSESTDGAEDDFETQDAANKLPVVEVEKEIEAFYEAVKNFSDVVVTFMPGHTGITNQELLAKLKTPQFRIVNGKMTIKLIQENLANHHILHFVGHGVFEKAPKKNASVKSEAAAYSEEPVAAKPRELKRRATWLLLEDEDGNSDRVEDDEIVHSLIQRGNENLPRLIFLSSCETSKHDERDPHRPFTSLGPKLVEAGFPAVVAMQDKVPMNVAGELTRNFYKNLLEEGMIDLALNRSRWFLYDKKKLLDDWTIPVLFMRTPHGQLFTADPKRVALRAISESEEFQPIWEYEYLPLDVVVLVQDQIKAKWENSVLLTRARVDLHDCLKRLLDGEDSPSPLIIALTGERGTARSTTAKAVVRETAVQSLKPTTDDSQQIILPIYVDLQSLIVPSGRVPSYLSLLAQSLKTFWPQSLSEEEVFRLLNERKLKFRIIFDNGDDLPDNQRGQLLEEISKLAGKFTSHQYLITMGRGLWQTELEKVSDKKVRITHLLDVQPISRNRMELFLDKCAEKDNASRQEEMESESDEGPQDSPLSSASFVQSELKAGERGKSIVSELRQRLERTQLFDLAAMPWMLVQMVRRAKNGDLPQSRVSLLRDLVESKISKVTQRRGQQARALDTLYELAYQMQRQNLPTLPVKDALATIAKVRDNREYALEEMLDELIELDLIARAGNDAVRFLYPQYQAYCTAQYLLRQNNPKIWEEITAGLGRITHLRRWNDTLTLLCGLLDDPFVLLEKIAYATSLKDGEQVYLAARCLLEIRQTENYPTIYPTGKQRKSKQTPAQSVSSVNNYVKSLVLDGLVWRSDSVNEPRSYQRLRAVEALGRQPNTEVVRYLARIAMEKMRINSLGEPDFEHGGIRQAAGRALRRLVSSQDSQDKSLYVDELLKANQHLAGLIHRWMGEDITWLEGKMKQPFDQLEDVEVLKTAQALAGMAAFALGDLRRKDSYRLLVEAFKDDATCQMVRWAITDALAVLDPAAVIEDAVHPMLDRLQKPTDANSERREQLIYMIGQLRHPDDQALKFVEEVLKKTNSPVSEKGRAILAIGYLQPPRWEEWKTVFEDIALGTFKTIKTMPKDDKEALYLRIKAMQALAEIGDLETLETLRKGRQQWPLELERVFYSASEEIIWRNNG